MKAICKLCRFFLIRNMCSKKAACLGLVLMVAGLVLPARAQHSSSTRYIAAKTNLLVDGLTVANIGGEIQLSRKVSLDVPFYCSPYTVSETWRLRTLAVQPEVRLWLSQAGEGHFLGVHAHLAGYNVAINDNGRYQDADSPLWGGGLSYGYALNLDRNKHWTLGFVIGAGFARYKWEAYRNWNNGPLFDQGDDWYWGITRCGITLEYKWYINRKK